MKNNSHWRKHIEIDQELISFCKEHVSLILPTLNEVDGLEQVIEASRDYCGELIVIDGHSNDGTWEKAHSLGVKRYRDNKKGKGDAIRVGIQKATKSVCVFIDSDLSHNPADIPRLIAPIMNSNADLVIGSRPRGGSDELHGDFEKFMRMIGSDIITLGINYRFNVRLTDSQNGFRAIKTSVAKSLNLQENITTIEQEMLIKALRKKFNVSEVPTHEFARKYGESHIKLSRVSFRYVYSWLKYLFL
ncbi:MAG: glycosyltransferase family 2 protein [Bacteriovoracaceae bacterium]|nr:glycosyltransferase family 2 protein [Bacteriovoracaceae bacterium]